MSYSPTGAVNNHQHKGAVNNHPKRNSNYYSYTPSDNSSDDSAPAPSNNQTPRRYNNDSRNNSRNNNRDNRSQNRSYNNNRNDRPRNQRPQRDYIPPPEPRIEAYIELIPTRFNSYQVRILSDQFWATGDFDNLRGLLHFFETLRKAIIHMNVKDRVEKLDPKYPAMLQAIQVEPPQDPKCSFFSEEVTPRVDGSTNYDEETWAKMFIQMLPRPSQPFPVNMETFKLICEISQQITQSEIAVIRYKLMQNSKGPMQSELNALGDRQDREGWSDEKYAAEEKKVIAKWNAKIYAERKKREKEIWDMYDKMAAYFNDANVADFSDRYILGTWIFITRNPCFPNSTITIGNITYPASQFSLIEVFTNPALSYAQVFAHIRQWYYSIHPNVNAIEPTQVEFDDWMRVCLFYDTSDNLGSFVSKQTNIETIACFDNNFFKFISSWIDTKFGQKPIAVAVTTYSEIIDGVEQTVSTNQKGAWVKSYNIYPYYSLRLFEESYAAEVVTFINALTERTFPYMSIMLSSFNHGVIRSNIVERLLKGHAEASALIKLAKIVNMDLHALAINFEREFIKLPRPSSDTLHTIPLLILSGTFSEPMIETIQRFITLFEGKDAMIADILKGFALSINDFADECKLIKPFIIDVATKIASTAKFGAAKYLSVDTIEAFEKLQ